MALVKVTEVGESRIVNETMGIKRYTRVYRVWYDAIVSDMATVKTANDGASAIPTLYTSTYPSDANMSVSGISVRPIDGTYEIFDVTVTYEITPRAGWQFLSPWNNDWTASVSTVDKTYVPQGAINSGPADREPGTLAVGDAVPNIQVNSANDPWDTPITDTKKLISINLSKSYIVAPTLENIKVYAGSVNDDTITILGRSFLSRTLMLDAYEVAAKQIDSAGNEYYTVNYRILFDVDTWDVDVLDNGWKDKDEKKILVGTNSNEIPVKPQPLDGKGYAAAAGTSVWLGNRIKSEEDWSTFAFPAVWP